MDKKVVYVVFGGYFYESSMVYGVFNFKADAEAFKKSRLADADNPLDYLSIEEFKVQ